MTADTDLGWPHPSEIQGFWTHDKMHAPRPLSPLSQDCVMATLSEGFTAAQAEYDSIMVASSRAINNYFYSSFHPHPDPAVIEDRMSRYSDTLNAKVPLVGKRWTEEWLPEIRSRNEAERDVDYSGMDEAALLTKFDEMTDWMRRQWYIHGHINFSLISGAALSDLYEEVMQPDDPTEAYQILQGHHTRPVDAAVAQWELSRIVRDSPELSALFSDHSPTELAGALAESETGRAFLTRLDEYLYDFGWRSDAVYDLADVPWREDPSIPLNSIGRFAALPDDANPGLQLERAVRLREDLTSKIRARLADEPERAAAFEELYEAAQYAYPLTEDHAFYIDQMGVVCFRRFVLAVGEKLALNGVIAHRDDVFFLRRAEVRDALTSGGDYSASVVERRAEWEQCARLDPPRSLGAPPPAPQPGAPLDPFVDALVTRLLGRKPPTDEVGDANLIDGVAGSPGVYTGVARVVHSLAEASELEDGEILVCEMTLPPWVPLFTIAGAVVADVGGVMSHCAIVAREFDLPAVVGSVDGTARIKTGQTVTVDGTNGNVWLDGRNLQV